MTNVKRIPKFEWQIKTASFCFGFRSFGLLSSFGIRHSDFRQSLLTSAVSRFNASPLLFPFRSGRLRQALRAKGVAKVHFGDFREFLRPMSADKLFGRFVHRAGSPFRKSDAIL